MLVFGDRDVDGITSTVTLVESLRELGGEVSWLLPQGDDSYGLSAAVIDRLVQEGVGLLITVDCGISNVEEMRLAAERGIDTVVVDHHNPPAGALPPALAADRSQAARLPLPVPRHRRLRRGGQAGLGAALRPQPPVRAGGVPAQRPAGQRRLRGGGGPPGQPDGKGAAVGELHPGDGRLGPLADAGVPGRRRRGAGLRPRAAGADAGVGVRGAGGAGVHRPAAPAGAAHPGGGRQEPAAHPRDQPPGPLPAAPLRRAGHAGLPVRLHVAEGGHGADRRAAAHPRPGQPGHPGRPDAAGGREPGHGAQGAGGAEPAEAPGPARPDRAPEPARPAAVHHRTSPGRSPRCSTRRGGWGSRTPPRACCSPATRRRRSSWWRRCWS